jgi:hypothetical protein
MNASVFTAKRDTQLRLVVVALAAAIAVAAMAIRLSIVSA